ATTAWSRNRPHQVRRTRLRSKVHSRNKNHSPVSSCCEELTACSDLKGRGFYVCAREPNSRANQWNANATHSPKGAEFVSPGGKSWVKWKDGASPGGTARVLTHTHLQPCRK